MLVLTRKLGQQVVMSLGGEMVTVGILKIAGGRVRVGIDAPSQIAVRRREIAGTLEPGSEQPCDAPR